MLYVKNLTPTEAEILPLVIEGLQYKQIASLKRISTRTVKFHVINIWHKLKVTGREDFLSHYGRFEVSVKWIPYEQGDIK